MRVLVLSQMYPRRDAPTYAGFIQRQTRALAAAGAEVTVLAPMQAAPWPLWWNKRWFKHGQVPLRASDHGLPVVWPRYWSPPGMKLHFVEGVTIARGLRPYVAELKAQRFEVIHANRLFPEGFAALELGRALGVPVVAMARGMDLNLIPGWGLPYRLQLRSVLRRAQGILSVSAALLEDARRIAAPRCPTAVVYNGVDPVAAASAAEKREIRRRYGLPAEGTLAGYVGRLEPDKGTPELIRAMGAVMRTEPHLHLAAVGQLRQESYRVDLERAGIGSRVTLLGERSYAETRAIMRAFDLFVFPSRLEGVPNAVLEAMSCGLPIACTAAGGTAEVVPSDAGFVCAVGDVRQLEKNVRTLVRRPELRRRMGAAGQRNVQRRFTWAASAQGLLEFYERIAGGEQLRQAA